MQSLQWLYKLGMYIQCRRRKLKDEVAEWLRHQTANLMGSARVSSNLILVKCIFVHLHAKFAHESLNLILVECIFVHLHAKFAMVIEAMYIPCRRRKVKDELAEWLRCQTANLMGSACVSLNLILVEFILYTCMQSLQWL